MDARDELFEIASALDDLGAPRLSESGRELGVAQRVRRLRVRLVMPGELLIRDEDEDGNGGCWGAEVTPNGIALVAQVGV